MRAFSVGVSIAPTLPTIEPTRVLAGDTWTWTRVFPDFPISEGWTVSYYIAGHVPITWAAAYATNDGTTWTIKIPASITAAVPPGIYRWAARVTDATDTFTAASGVMVVELDLGTAEEHDAQSHAERMVIAIEAELEARVTGTGSAHQSYTIGSRQLQNIPILELRALLGQYRAEVARQRTPTRMGRRVVSRFTVPS